VWEYLVIIRLLSGIRSSFSPDRYPVDYYPVSGKTVSGTSLYPILVDYNMKDNKTIEIVFLKNESRTMIIFFVSDFVSESQSQLDMIILGGIHPISVFDAG
jgi:hypothetical protein